MMEVFESAATMNTEHSVNRAIVGDWLREMDTEMDKLNCPWMVAPRLKVILTRVACKVHGKDKSPGENSCENYLPKLISFPCVCHSPSPNIWGLKKRSTCSRD